MHLLNNHFYVACVEIDSDDQYACIKRDISAERFVKQLLDIGNGKMVIDKHTQCITLSRNFCKIIASKDKLFNEVFFRWFLLRYD